MEFELFWPINQNDMEGIFIGQIFFPKSRLLEMEPPGDKNSLIYQTHVFLKKWFSQDQLISLQTSGSTGTPKQILVKKAQMIQSAQMTINFLGLKKADTALLYLSPKYIAGMMMIVRALVGQLKLFVALSADKLTGIPETPIDFAAMVPLQFLRLAQAQPDAMSRIKTLILGGSSLPHETELMASTFDTKIYHTYGMTETLSHIAMRRVNGNDKSPQFTILQGVEISTDERSCLIIRTPYTGMHPIQTNDIAELIDQRNFIIKGRWDDVINMSGMKLFPQLIEQKISGKFSVPLAIVGITDDRAGQLPVLAVEAQWSSRELYEAWKTLEILLEPYEIPRKIVLFERLPLLETGKIARNSIRKLIEGQ